MKVKSLVRERLARGKRKLMEKNLGLKDYPSRQLDGVLSGVYADVVIWLRPIKDCSTFKKEQSKKVKAEEYVKLFAVLGAAVTKRGVR